MAKPWPVAGGLAAEILPAASAEAIALAWADLAARALEPNAFYAPPIALSGLRHLPEGRGATLLLAWRGDGETRRLVGLLPVARARGRYTNPFATRRAAAHYGTLSTPLLDPDRPAETLDAMLAAAARAGIRALMLPFLHEEGAVADALRLACAGSGRPTVRLDGHRRALLRSPLGGEAYVKATLEPKRRKEADRQRRRLAEEAPLAFRLSTEPDAVGAALEEFLVLEAAGWKGRAGTALARAPGAADFVREAARRGAEAGSFAVATLMLGNRPVAAGLVAYAGRRAFYLKTAYDEAHARSSPGLLLTLDLTRHLLDDPAVDDADSIAVADHPMIDRVWTERFPVEAVMAATRPGGGLLFRVAVTAEQAREGAVARLKAWLAGWRAAKAARAAAHAPGGKDAARKVASEPSA